MITIPSQEPALRHCASQDVVMRPTACHCLHSQLQSPLAYLPNLAIAKKETRYFSALGEQQFLSARSETHLLIALLCCSLLWALTLAGKSPLVAPTCAVAKLHSPWLMSFLLRGNLCFYECGEVTKAFSFTLLKP